MGIPIHAKRIRRIRVPCKASHSSEVFQKDIQMLQYFQDEFMYRHKHFWQLLTKLFILTIVVTIAPITTQVAGVIFNDSIKSFSLCFPVLGLILASLGFHILQSEAKRMHAVNDAKKRINKKIGKRYRYETFDKSAQKDTTLKNTGKHNLLAFQLPVLIFVTEFIIAVGVFVVLLRTPIQG